MLLGARCVMKKWSTTHRQPIGVPCCQRSSTTPDVVTNKNSTYMLFMSTKAVVLIGASASRLDLDNAGPRGCRQPFGASAEQKLQAHVFAPLLRCRNSFSTAQRTATVIL
jgi:hypothetical protein